MKMSISIFEKTSMFFESINAGKHIQKETSTYVYSVSNISQNHWKLFVCKLLLPEYAFEARYLDKQGKMSFLASQFVTQWSACYVSSNEC